MLAQRIQSTTFSASFDCITGSKWINLNKYYQKPRSKMSLGFFLVPVEIPWNEAQKLGILVAFHVFKASFCLLAIQGESANEGTIDWHESQLWREALGGLYTRRFLVWLKHTRHSMHQICMTQSFVLRALDIETKYGLYPYCIESLCDSSHFSGRTSP